MCDCIGDTIKQPAGQSLNLARKVTGKWLSQIERVYIFTIDSKKPSKQLADQNENVARKFTGVTLKKYKT